MANDSNYILLNKPFAGGWIDEQGHIAHEIIDFFKDDNGKHYFYNLPFGGIVAEKGLPEYIFLTSKVNNGVMYIEYILKPKKKEIHNYTCGYNTKRRETKFLGQQEKVVEFCESENITYGGVPLTHKSKPSIYSLRTDDSLFLTYEINNMWELEQPYRIELKNGLNKWRTVRTINSDKEMEKDLYNELLEMARKVENNQLAIKNATYPMEISESEEISFSYHTFLDVIGKAEEEQCYTNILCKLFNSSDNFWRHFLGIGEIKEKIFVPDSVKFNIKSEYVVEGGRMDIYAYSINDNGEPNNDYAVVIENKIDCDLNGEKNSQTQLGVYWDSIKEVKNKLIIVLTPKRHYKKIQAEIDKEIKDEDLKNHIAHIDYSELPEIVEKCKDEIIKMGDCKKFYVDLRELFLRQGTTADLLHKSLFLNAIKKLKNS